MTPTMVNNVYFIHDNYAKCFPVIRHMVIEMDISLHNFDSAAFKVILT